MLTRLWPYLALTVLCLAVYLPGLTALPPLDRDEARFGQATTQMLESGDFIDIRFQGTPRYKKPAGIYWLQAASVFLFSNPEARQIWAYRLPSVLGAWLAVLGTFAIGHRLFDRRIALLGAALTATSLLLVLEAHQAKTDAVLLATVVAGQGALAAIYVKARQSPETTAGGWRIGGAALLFWLAQGVGILIKGPITPLVALLTVLALTLVDPEWRWLRGLHLLPGAILAALIVAPWAVAMWMASGSSFVTTAVATDLLPKLLGGQESHGAPPGYYALLMLAFFWPGSLFAWPALAQAWRDRLSPAVRFCLAWLVPAWLMFELIPTKLPHYALPLYPALALLTAAAVVAAAESRSGPLIARWARIAYALWAVIGIALAAAALAAPVALGDGFTWWSLAAAAAALAAAVVPVRQAWRRRPLVAICSAIVLAALALATTFGGVVPRLNALWVSRAVAADLARLAPGNVLPVAVAGFAEPSIVFLLGTETRLTDGAGAARALISGQSTVAVIEERQAQAFRRALGQHAAAVRTLAHVAGVNYSKGRKVELVIYRMDR